jgi:hypothetical protein
VTGEADFSRGTFVGTGTPGVVARVSATARRSSPWVTLPGENGLLRGSLHVDRTGVFGGTSSWSRPRVESGV